MASHDLHFIFEILPSEAAHNVLCIDLLQLFLQRCNFGGEGAVDQSQSFDLAPMSISCSDLSVKFGGVSVEKIDDLRVKFKVEVPKYNTGDFIASLQPIQKKQFEKEADFNRSKENMKPIGNSAYKFKAFSRDQSIVLERVPGWWGEQDPEYRAAMNFDQITYRIIPDPTLAYERLLPARD